MDRLSLFHLRFSTESYSRESGLESFMLKLITGRVCLIKTKRTLRLGNRLPEQRRNVSGKVHSGTITGAASWESLGSVQELLAGQGPVWAERSCGKALHESPGPGQRCWGRQAGEEEPGSDAAHALQGRTAPADFLFFL